MVGFALQNFSHVHSGNPTLTCSYSLFFSRCNCHYRQPHVSVVDTITKVRGGEPMNAVGIGHYVN